MHADPFVPTAYARRYGLLCALTLLCLAPLAGCVGGDTDFRPLATGPEGEVVVVIDSVHWRGAIGDSLRNTLGAYIATLPAPERSFDLRPVVLTSEDRLEEVRQRKNVVIVAPLDDSTNEARYLRNVFDEAAQGAIREGQPAVIGRPNLWRRSQQVYFVTAPTAEGVAAALAARGDEMRRTFNRITRERTAVEMFERGRQTDLEQTLMEHHGFAVNVQHDYVIAVDTTNFVWLRRILTDTWRSLFVYYEENANPTLLTPEWIYATRDSLTRQYVQGNVRGYVQIADRRPLETENIEFLGRFGYETRGLWHLVEKQDGRVVYEGGMGGPFLTYAFYDEPSRRLYLIDGMVFAPGFDKREFLRQLEVIAHTFRTRQDAAAQQPMAQR